MQNKTSKKFASLAFDSELEGQTANITAAPHLSCNLCNFATFSESAMVAHVFDVHELFHNCYLCHSGLESWQEFLTHMRRRHLPSVSKLYFCKECNATRSDFELFVLHHEKHFRRKRRRRDQHELVTITAKTSQPAARLKRATVEVSPNSSASVIEHAPQSFQCRLCDHSSRSIHALDDHMRRHLDVRQFLCAVCAKAFVSKGELSRHISCRHPDASTTKHQCPECQFYSWRKDVLVGHISKTHATSETAKPRQAAKPSRKVPRVDSFQYDVPAENESNSERPSVLRSILTSDSL